MLFQKVFHNTEPQPSTDPAVDALTDHRTDNPALIDSPQIVALGQISTHRGHRPRLLRTPGLILNLAGRIRARTLIAVAIVMSSIIPFVHPRKLVAIVAAAVVAAVIAALMPTPTTTTTAVQSPDADTDRFD